MPMKRDAQTDSLIEYYLREHGFREPVSPEAYSAAYNALLQLCEVMYLKGENDRRGQELQEIRSRAL